MIAIDVFDLMADYRGELVFTVHQSEQALAYIDVSTGNGEGIDEIASRNVMKFIRQFAMSMGRNTRSYLAEVALDFGSVAILFVSRETVSARDSLPMRISSSSDMRVNLTGMRVSSCSVSAIKYSKAAGAGVTSTLRCSVMNTAARPRTTTPVSAIQRVINIGELPPDAACIEMKPEAKRCPAQSRSNSDRAG